MKVSRYFLILVFFLNITLLSGQHNSNKRYDTWVKVIGQKREIKAYLLELRSSSILIQTVESNKNKFPTQIAYQLNQIERISFRNKRGFLNGAIAGMVPGMFTGVIIGAQDDDTDFFFLPEISIGVNTVFMALVCAIPTSLVGGLIGDSKRRYKLNGSQHKYDSYRSSWEKYIYPKHKLPPLPK